MFLYPHQHEINLWSLMFLIFLLLHSCYFVIWGTKIHEYTITYWKAHLETVIFRMPASRLKYICLIRAK